MKEKFNEPPVELGENDSDYKYALEAVTRLFHKDKYFVRKLRRESQRSFRDITKEEFKQRISRFNPEGKCASLHHSLDKVQTAELSYWEHIRHGKTSRHLRML